MGKNLPPIPPDLDEKVRVTAADAATDYLNNKISVTGGLLSTPVDVGGGVQVLQLDAVSVPGDHKVRVDASDTLPEYLAEKIAAAGGLSATTFDKNPPHAEVAILLDASGVPGDHKVLASPTDILAETLIEKIVGSGNITATSYDKGGGIQGVRLTVPADQDIKAKVSAADTTTDYLDSKVAVAGGLTKSILNPGVNEQLQISASGITPESTSVANVGTGAGLVYRDMTGAQINLKTVKAGTGVSVTNNANDVTIANSLPENTTVANVGTGAGQVYRDKTGDQINLKTIKEGVATGIQVINAADEVMIYNTLPEATTVANVGTGTGQVYRDKTGDQINLKTVKAGTNITSVVNNADDVTINAATQAGDHKIAISSDDTTPDYAENKLVMEGGTVQTNNPAGNEVLQFRPHPVFHDTFLLSKPFWVGTQAITSGDFGVDAVNHYLSGLAANNTQDWIRFGVEGDFDYIGKFYTNGATQAGWHVEGNSLVVTWKVVPGSSQIQRTCTGESQVNVAYASQTVWLRVKREFTKFLHFYHRVNDTDGWTLDATADLTKDLGYDVKLSLLSGVNSRIYEIALFDNMPSQRVKQNVALMVPLTDGATITPDLRMGNLFSVTLGGNRTIGAPTGGQVPTGTMFVLRVRQDASPPRTLSWNSIYRFPSGTAPTLSTGANKTDYFGFIYNAIDTKYDCIAQEFNL